MNWSSASDILALLMTIYICVGVLVCTSLVMYYIIEEKLTHGRFAFSFEMILLYGPIAAVLWYFELVKFVKRLWAVDYKGWYEVQKEAYRVWREYARETREFEKKLKDARKK